MGVGGDGIFASAISVCQDLRWAIDQWQKVLGERAGPRSFSTAPPNHGYLPVANINNYGNDACDIIALPTHGVARHEALQPHLGSFIVSKPY